MKKTTKKAAEKESLWAIDTRGVTKKARAKRWTVTFVDRPFDDRDEFLNENEVWILMKRVGRSLHAEKVEPKK